MKILEFTKSKYIHKVEYVEFKKNIYGVKHRVKRVIIVIENNKNKRSIVHPFSTFIVREYGEMAVKTQIDYAQRVATFLNFLLESNRKIELQLLDVEDIIMFLKFKAVTTAKKTINLYKRILINLYLFLIKRGFLKKVDVTDFELIEKETNRGNIRYYDIPVVLDYKNEDLNHRTLHIMHNELVKIFLDIAFNEVNEIALGVIFQIFGGLRVGEVINLTYSAISPIGSDFKNGAILDIRNRELRGSRANNQGKGYCKKKRKQRVFSPNGILGFFYTTHKRKYKKKNTMAIFINKKGEAMSYESYIYYFKKLKSIFLEKLKESNDPRLKTYGLLLISRKWGTHIGRGIFTNMLMSINESGSYISHMRGDSSIASKESYIEDIGSINKKIEDSMNNMFKKIKGKEDEK
ncbi:hypothetical protein HMPREF1092_02958 [Clostridium thermobutyricum]|uniref:Core-binding (CB) domain-containing protein n=1 Tax=Clostridium thermobutyricum TaxID=29372 RepID=N9XJF2_9CLOT|nr:hypothetical protein [Clostridium thermobutyricum]ENY99822.1 hypothetical protein HMPREF1092_02958 [Clostridium thermobutyricum]